MILVRLKKDLQWSHPFNVLKSKFLIFSIGSWLHRHTVKTKFLQHVLVTNVYVNFKLCNKQSCYAFLFWLHKIFFQKHWEDEVPFKCNRNLLLMLCNLLKFVQGKENTLKFVAPTNSTNMAHEFIRIKVVV